MSIKITFDDKKIRIMLKDFKDKADTARFSLLKIGFLVNHAIQDRVQNKGEGLNGSKLAKYSDKYGAYRKKKGRETSFRNLTFTGRMFLGLSARADGPNRVVLGFAGPEMKKAMGNDKRTPFFGLGTVEQKVIDTEIDKILKGSK